MQPTTATSATPRALVAVQATSADAYHQQGPKGRMRQSDQVMAVVRAARAQGTANMTCSEITQALQREYPHVGWHQGKASARINLLKAEGGPLIECEKPRPCTVTGRLVQPVMLRPVQERLVA